MTHYIYVLLVAGILLVDQSECECPSSVALSPLQCICAYDNVQCHDVQTADHFKKIMAVCSGLELKSFYLFNSTLDLLPVDTFTHINARDIFIMDSFLRSLTEPGGGEKLFKGAGIRSFFIYDTTVDDGDLSPIRYLNDLFAFGLRGHKRNVSARTIVEYLGDKSLKRLNLEDLPNFQWERGVLDDLNLLSLSLCGLNFTEFVREDLPKNVYTIQYFWLRGNELRSVPEDLIWDMKNLEWFDVSINYISTLTEPTLRDFSGTLAIYGNPLHCDSKLDWLRKRVQQKSLNLRHPSRVICDDGNPFIKE